MVNPNGVSKWVNPHRFIFVNSPSFKNTLWCIEESLRIGIPPLIIAELEQIPTLTQIRRMHLAAKSCKSSKVTPLPLILTPKDGGALGVETRWHIRPNNTNTPYQWKLDLTRARLVPEKKFFLTGIRNKLEISLPTWNELFNEAWSRHNKYYCVYNQSWCNLTFTKLNWLSIFQISST